MKRSGMGAAAAGPSPAGKLACDTGRSRPRARAGGLFVLMAASLWGTTGTAATFAPRGSSPLAIGAAAMGIGGVVMLLGAGRGAVRLIAAQAANRTLMVGAGCVIAYPLAFYTSMSDAGVAIGVTLTIGSAPIVAALLERVLHGRRLSRRWVAAVAVAVLGAALLGSSVAGITAHTTSQIVAGVILAPLAGCCYAGYSIAAAQLVDEGTEPRAAVGALFGLAAAVLLPLLALTGSSLLASPRGMIAAGYLGLVPMGTGYVLFAYGLQTTTASSATALSLLEPAVAAILADVVARQHVPTVGWIGIALVAVSVLSQARTTLASR